MARTSEQLELLEKAKKESEHHELSFALYREQVGLLSHLGTLQGAGGVE
jgi:hypothetical protein